MPAMCMPMMMPITTVMLVTCRVTCEMTKDGMVCKVMPADKSQMTMLQERCDAGNSARNQSLFVDGIQQDKTYMNLACYFIFYLLLICL